VPDGLCESVAAFVGDVAIDEEAMGFVVPAVVPAGSLPNGAWTNKRAFEQPIVRVDIYVRLEKCRLVAQKNWRTHANVAENQEKKKKKKGGSSVGYSCFLSVTTPSQERESVQLSKKNLFVKRRRRQIEKRKEREEKTMRNWWASESNGREKKQFSNVKFASECAVRMESSCPGVCLCVCVCVCLVGREKEEMMMMMRKGWRRRRQFINDRPLATKKRKRGGRKTATSTTRIQQGNSLSPTLAISSTALFLLTQSAFFLVCMAKTSDDYRLASRLKIDERKKRIGEGKKKRTKRRHYFHVHRYDSVFIDGKKSRIDNGRKRDIHFFPSTIRAMKKIELEEKRCDEEQNAPFSLGTYTFAEQVMIATGIVPIC
jgi:hypothetical protein